MFYFNDQERHGMPQVAEQETPKNGIQFFYSLVIETFSISYNFILINIKNLNLTPASIIFATL